MSNNTYSFLDVVAALVGPGGVATLGSGAATSEEGITVTPTGDRSTMQIGADGNGQHSLNGDRSGTITVTLLKTSLMNAVLMAMYNLQTASAAQHGQNTISIADKNRGDICSASQVAFKRVPDMKFQSDAGTNEWVFDAIRIDYAYGV